MLAPSPRGTDFAVRAGATFAPLMWWKLRVDEDESGDQAVEAAGSRFPQAA